MRYQITTDRSCREYRRSRVFRRRHVLRLSLVALCLGGCAEPQLTSFAGYPISASSASQVVPDVRDWQSLNEGRVVMQRYDYSCGAAALATLMRYYFSDQVDERDLINDVSSLFDEAAGKRISSEGLSLLELQTIARNRGYQSASVRLEPSALAKLGGPVIVYLRTPDFRHYAVLRGLKDGKAWLADPSRGNLVMPLAAFLDEWHGETFVLGKEGFGVPGDFPLALDQASAPPVLPAPHDSTRRLSRFMRLPN